MTRSQSDSRGEALVARFRRGQRQADNAARPGARSLPRIHGVNPDCVFTRPQENVLVEAQSILLESQRVYRYGSNVVMEIGTGADRHLVNLATGQKLEAAASSLLANLMIFEILGNDNSPPRQFPPPKRLVELLLNHQPTVEALPCIELYATRPVFDRDFVYRGPGWHPEVRILVHGPEIEPRVPPGPPVEGAHGLRRLPPYLRELLQDFCLRDGADWANTVAMLLTGMLMSSFAQGGKPVVLLDGNQPGVGKTLLARVLGIILDGIDPEVIHYTADDEELAKRICASLRGRAQSLVIIDNARVNAGCSISSPVIEANSMAAQISLRILGQSANYSRPNDLIWAVTMNDTRTSPDLVSRGLPIRFYLEGEPRQRDFGGRDPLVFAREHRTEILGELAGMVTHWTQQGQPQGHRTHRCARWASVIGGVLETNGVEGFLQNLDEAASTFNTELDALIALAEAVLELDGPIMYTDPNH